MLSTLARGGKTAAGCAAMARLSDRARRANRSARSARSTTSRSTSSDGEFIAILGSVRLRQDDAAAPDRRLRQARRRPHRHRRRQSSRRRRKHVPPERRRIGIVFQSYALWPHMSVAENVAYGLTVAGVREPERTRRVDAALAAGRARRLRRAAAVDALGRPAAARRARALPRHRAVAGAARRAAGQSRRPSARFDGARVRALSRAHRDDDDLHHARSGRSDGACRPHRGDGARAACCSSPRRRSSIASPPTTIVAAFIGEGMVVPVEVRAVERDGTCLANAYGYERTHALR